MTTLPSSPEFGDFGDPEDTDWIPPPVPAEVDLPDNTRVWGPFFLWAGPSNQRAMIAFTLTREIHPPWRRGPGIGIRGRKGCGYAVGIWWKSKPPRILSQQPGERDLLTVIERANRLDKLHVD